MVAIPFKKPCKIPADIPLVRVYFWWPCWSCWLCIGKYSTSWRMAHGQLSSVSGGNEQRCSSMTSFLFIKELMIFFVVLFFGFFQGVKGGLRFGFALVAWFFGVFFQLVPALNYLAQLLLATIPAARSSAWLIPIQLVCWQTEFCAVLTALSGLWTSFNYINNKCTSQVFASCQKHLCSSGICEERAGRNEL